MSAQSRLVIPEDVVAVITLLHILRFRLVLFADICKVGGGRSGGRSLACCIWNGQVETDTLSCFNRTDMVKHDLFDTGETDQWLEPWTRDRKVAGFSPGRGGGKMFFSRGNFLC